MSGVQHASGHKGLVGRGIVVGFTSAIAVWIAWFATHLPWVGMSEHASVPLLLVVWLLAGAVAVAWTGPGRAIQAGAVGGVIAALTSLLILPSKLLPAATAAGPVAAQSMDQLPPVPLVILGFLLLGGVLGVVGGVLSLVLPSPRRIEHNYLSQLALVVSVGITPLLVVGGLVTSTNSGMAVPDWPNTYGSNMFLYPLGPRSAPGLFLEHSHRLFGTLVGLMTLVLTVWVCVKERRAWVRNVAIVALCLVIAQGVLGGVRVRAGSTDAAEDQPILAMLHGVLAQLVFGVVVALAATLSPLFTSSVPVVREPSVRRFKFFATGLTHALILQLLFGAAYRHLRNSHALWTHAGFSVLIVILAILAGFVAMSLARKDGGEGLPAGPAAEVPDLARTLRRIGIGLVVVVGLQFALGWAAFFVGGAERTAASAGEALVRTAHQANGAVLIALASLAFVWARWVHRRATGGDSAAACAA